MSRGQRGEFARRRRGTLKRAPRSIAVAILLAGCARQPAEVERTAILRFENLSGDSSVSWQGRALSEVVAAEIDAIPTARLRGLVRAMGVRPISAPGISAESAPALASGATRIGYGEYTVRNGRIEARLTLEDARTLKMVKVVEASAPSGDVLGVAGALARQISTHTARFGTRSPEALMFFIKAVEARDGASTEQGLAQAIAADPDFAPPYHNLAQLKAQQRDIAGALATIEQAMARKSIPEIERAHFELESADLRGDGGARLTALVKLTGLDASDANVWRALADTAMSRHEYRQAMQAYQKCSQALPNDVEALNMLGYSAAQAGELETAMAALRRYQTLRPGDGNPLDSMGDVNMATGHLAEAENFYLQAQKKDRTLLNDGDLMKAALARLLTGDAAAASKIADQYFEARKADATVDYRRAQWTWITGRRKEAMRAMEAFASNPKPLQHWASMAWTELSLWNLMLDDRSTATQQAQKALSVASQASAGNAVVARFMAMPAAAPAEWAVRAEKQFPDPGLANIRNLALAYALLANREFAAAQPLLKQMWDNGAPMAGEGLPVVLAWSYMETGKVQEAAALLRENPIPPRTGVEPYTTLYLPRLFYLRGLLAEKEGRGAEAREQYRKFVELSGPVPLIWAEEKKAGAGR